MTNKPPSEEELRQRILDQVCRSLQVLWGPMSVDVRQAARRYRYMAHYTSSPAFASIVTTRELWLGHIGNMNDYTEAEVGTAMVLGAIHYQWSAFAPRAKRMKSLVFRYFEAAVSEMRHDIYVNSLTGQRGQECVNGRLDMWRAYGADGRGVCLNFDKEEFLSFEKGPCSFLQMKYHEPIRFIGQTIYWYFSLINLWIERDKTTIKFLGKEAVAQIFAWGLLDIAMMYKNPSYSSESEFRLVHYKPLYSKPWSGDNLGTYDGVVVNGELKPVFKLPLNLREALRSVIIGPSDRMEVRTRAVEALLKQNGLDHVPIHVSNIPYASLR